MFLTIEGAQCVFPPALEREHITQWHYILHELHLRWFHIEFNANWGDEDPVSQVMMTAELDQLVRLSELADVKLRNVNLVSPGYTNGTNSWKLEQLVAVWRQDNRGDIFELADGTRYYEAFPITLEGVEAGSEIREVWRFQPDHSDDELDDFESV